jgi:A/G-specific adenine glycosylase
MELGALICKARTPLCEECPLQNLCLWRSKGYPELAEVKKRAAWHGSDRQCRGVILQALRERSEIDENDLITLWSNQSQYEKALTSLIDDGLIEQRGKRFTLAN